MTLTDAKNVNLVELDCKGLKCPRPIIEVAKLARTATPNMVLRVTADDLAFESDIDAWCETTDTELVSLEKSGGQIVATISFSKRG